MIAADEEIAAALARPLGGRDRGDARRRRPPPLRGRGGAARRARAPARFARRRRTRRPLPFRAQAPASAARSHRRGRAELESEVRSGYRVVVAFEHRGEAERARYNLERARRVVPRRRLPAEPGVLLRRGAAGRGLRLARAKLAVIPWRKLVHRRRAAAAAPVRGPLASMADLRVGDHVVHEDHGIARFAGFETKTVAGVTRDYLELEYRGEDRVFAPDRAAGQDHPLRRRRRRGAAALRARLEALGLDQGAGAPRGAGELAGDLLNLYAERAARRGHAFGPDGEWSLQLEQAFPYRETADQLEAIEAVKADMESRAADGPADLRRRRLRQDGGRAARRGQGRGGRQAGDDARADDRPRPAAPGHLPRALRRLPFEVESVSRLRKPAEVKRDARGVRRGEASTS